MLSKKQERIVNRLEKVFETEHQKACDLVKADCTICPFRYDGEYGGYSCTIVKMERLAEYVKDNAEDEE